MNLTRLRSGIWQVELRIPKDVREQIGRIRFAKSTGTRDKQEARRKSLDLLSQWHREIEAVRCTGGPSGFCKNLSGIDLSALAIVMTYLKIPQIRY